MTTKRIGLEEKGASLYILACSTPNVYKIGVSNNVKARVRAIGGTHTIVFAAFFDSRKNAFKKERYFQKRFADKRTGRSWELEWFNLSTADINCIRSHTLLDGGVSQLENGVVTTSKGGKKQKKIEMPNNIMGIMNHYAALGESDE